MNGSSAVIILLSGACVGLYRMIYNARCDAKRDEEIRKREMMDKERDIRTLVSKISSLKFNCYELRELLLVSDMKYLDLKIVHTNFKNVTESEKNRDVIPITPYLIGLLEKLPETDRGCSICCETIDAGEMCVKSCGHVFHTKCKDQWEKQSKKCATCMK